MRGSEQTAVRDRLSPSRPRTCWDLSPSPRPRLSPSPSRGLDVGKAGRGGLVGTCPRPRVSPASRRPASPGFRRPVLRSRPPRRPPRRPRRPRRPASLK
jgi:hypothetical protein